MVPKELLHTVVLDQLAECKLAAMTVKREMLERIAVKTTARALIIKGVRRCGKSTALKQLMAERFKGKFFYLNFDDERLIGFEADDFQKLMEVFIELFGNRPAIFLDEIQNVRGWELFVNRLLREGRNVFITGSNANLLSRELGTHLTGRHLDYELYPFSFSEYLALRGVDLPRQAASTSQKTLLLKEFKKYMEEGGMPEAAISRNPAVLGQTIEDIVQKDIIRRYSVRKPNELRGVLRFLIANASNKITFNSICDNFRIKSPVTAQNYVNYAEDTCLIFTVRKYERKIKLLDKNPKKLYCIDNGIIARHSSGAIQQMGALLENLVAVELKRRNCFFYYYMNKNGSETDFAILAEETPKKITQVLQACLDPSDVLTMQREEKALLSTLNETGLSEGLVVTLDFEETKKKEGKAIRYVPAWKWLLEG
ncbi:hypothetical protein AUJ17_00415 [Candidatus Micrarchaeota archaeon CG1_02_47_40]|nr:MAG: hypothetical protein AUJ17_00415 [Candidatus Micrarchaeota archaeon CG1_02_47_40]